MVQTPVMDTLVLQSYRTHDVPFWMDACMASVRAWTRQSGWDYQFMDDAFFSLAPDWVRKRCAGNPYAVTDVCRLTWLRQKLASGHARVIWADADMLVFDPQNLVIPAGIGHGFARELFLQINTDGTTTPVHGINNALMVFERGDTLLETYLDACLVHLRTLPPGPVPRTALGPAMLAAMSRGRALNAIEGIGLFSLAVMQDIALGGGPLVAEYLRLSSVPPAAANLCHFLRNATPLPQRPFFDAAYNDAVIRLVASRGAVLAGALPTNQPAPDV
jgi:hypothetical protein